MHIIVERVYRSMYYSCKRLLPQNQNYRIIRLTCYVRRYIFLSASVVVGLYNDNSERMVKKKTKKKREKETDVKYNTHIHTHTRTYLSSSTYVQTSIKYLCSLLQSYRVRKFVRQSPRVKIRLEKCARKRRRESIHTW